MPSQLGIFFKKSSIKAGYSNEEVSRISIVSNRTIQRFENSEYYIKSETLIKLVKVYGIDLRKI